MHTLADELTGWLQPVTRVIGICARIVDAYDGRALDPAAIVIADDDTVRLTSETRIAEADAVHAFGVLLRELLAGRYVLALVQDCTGPLAQRPRFDEVRARMRNEGWGTQDLPAWQRAYEPQAIERELVAAMRVDPAARTVYADWLEQHAQMQHAAYLRTRTGARPEDATWRALVGDPPIEQCADRGCPKQWQRLAPTRFDNVASCATCAQAVHYCTTQPEYDSAHGPRVRDVAVPLRSPPRPGAYVTDVAYSTDPPGRTIFGRLFDLLRRR